MEAWSRFSFTALDSFSSNNTLYILTIIWKQSQDTLTYLFANATAILLLLLQHSWILIIIIWADLFGLQGVERAAWCCMHGFACMRLRIGVTVPLKCLVAAASTISWIQRALLLVESQSSSIACSRVCHELLVTAASGISVQSFGANNWRSRRLPNTFCRRGARRFLLNLSRLFQSYVVEYFPESILLYVQLFRRHIIPKFKIDKSQILQRIFSI